MLTKVARKPEKGKHYYYVESFSAAIVEVVEVYEGIGPESLDFPEDWVGYDLRVVACIHGEFSPGEEFHFGWVEGWGPEGELFEIEE